MSVFELLSNLQFRFRPDSWHPLSDIISSPKSLPVDTRWSYHVLLQRSGGVTTLPSGMSLSGYLAALAPILEKRLRESDFDSFHKKHLVPRPQSSRRTLIAACLENAQIEVISSAQGSDGTEKIGKNTGRTTGVERVKEDSHALSITLVPFPDDSNQATVTVWVLKAVVPDEWIYTDAEASQAPRNVSGKRTD